MNDDILDTDSELEDEDTLVETDDDGEIVDAEEDEDPLNNGFSAEEGEAEETF